jgi:hypothetical protein
MKAMLVVIALLLGSSMAQAQSAIPDIKGTWSSKAGSVILGANQHHPAQGADAATPRVQEIEFTLVVAGQQGPFAWGYNFSAVSSDRESFVLSIASDGKTIIGADTDGYYNLRLVSPDRMEVCYAHAGNGPSKSILATCSMMDRKK